MKNTKSVKIRINLLLVVLLCMCITACRPRHPQSVALEADNSEAGVVENAEDVSPALSTSVPSQEFRDSMQAQVNAFLDSDLSNSRAPLAAQAYRAMEQGLAGLASAEINMMLASLAGGLVACAGDQSQQVAAALLSAATPQQQEIVLAAIAAVQGGAHTNQLIEAAVKIFNTMDADHIKAVVEHPSDHLESPVLQSVTQSASGFLLLKQARAAGETSLFADRDGGKQPASRRESSSTGKEGL